MSLDIPVHTIHSQAGAHASGHHSCGLESWAEGSHTPAAADSRSGSQAVGTRVASLGRRWSRSRAFSTLTRTVLGRGRFRSNPIINRARVIGKMDHPRRITDGAPDGLDECDQFRLVVGACNDSSYCHLRHAHTTPESVQIVTREVRRSAFWHLDHDRRGPISGRSLCRADRAAKAHQTPSCRRCRARPTCRL
jgi:hypothetical protein